ncbi:hypothetical protein LINPERPRIM_LOCUS9978 [Linum perenne]
MEKTIVIKLAAFFFISFLCSTVNCSATEAVDESLDCGRKEGCNHFEVKFANWCCKSDIDCAPYTQCPNHPKCVDCICECT